MVRYKVSKDFTNDCLTICDVKDELKTSFDSDITLAPLEDALVVVAELNRKECVIHEFKEVLRENHFDEDEIEVIVDAGNDSFEELQE